MPRFSRSAGCNRSARNASRFSARSRSNRASRSAKRRVATERAMAQAVEWLERPRGAVLEDDPRARDPVRLLAVIQVADDVERAPGAFAFVRDEPGLGQSRQHRAQHDRRAAQHRDRFVEVVRPHAKRP
jgi:hypothetical protein